MENNNYLTRSFRSWYACLMVSVLFLASTGTHAQTITNYAFSSDSLGTFTPISGGTNVPAVQADDANSASLPIGFTFYYMGLPYTSVSACSNGFLYLGTGSFNSLTNGLASTGGVSRPILAPLWDDENGAGALPAGVASYITTGSPGSRVFTFEWLNWRWYYTASVATISYQCKLYEATGAVQFVYRNDAASTPGSATIGISAVGTGSGNFLSLGSSGTNPSVSSTTETTTITGNPVSGQTYTFTPPQTPPAAPDSLYFTSVTTNSMTVGWKDNSTDETNFQVFISTDGINYTPASSLTSTSVATTGTLYSANLTGLFPGTTYYVQVFSNTEGVLSSALSGSQATVNVVPICGTFTVSNLLTTDIGLSQFASLADAASYLSQNGTCGALTLNVAAGHTETAPANGISFSFCSFPDSLRPGASSPLIIQKSGAGANPLITAFTPGVTTTVDGIFKLVGADYVTIDGIDLQENAANTTATAQMEWGYALLKCSGNDGSNYNTIKNCVVTLNKANTGSKAIYSGNHTAANTTALTYTGLAGTEDAARNGHNTFYGNTLQNTAYGINLNGNTALSPNGNNISLNDTLNQVGVTGQARNVIVNFGGTSTTAYGIYLTNQRGITCSNDSINGGTGSTGTLYGIYAPSGVWGTFNDNRVTLTSSATTATNYGIYAAYSGGVAGNPNVLTVNNNIVSGCNFSAATSSIFYGIYASGGGTGSTTNMNGNQVINNTGLSTTATLYLTYMGGGDSQNFMNNTVSGNTRRASAPSGTMYCFYSASSAPAGGTVSGNTISNNTVTAMSGASTATIYGMYLSGTSPLRTFSGNTISNLSISGASTGASSVYGTYMSSGSIFSGNTISSLSTGVGQNGNIYGIQVSGGTSPVVSGNKICDLSSGGSTTATARGLYITSGTTVSAYNNIIGNLTASFASPAAATVNVIGVDITGGTTVNLDFNTIRLSGSGGNTNFGSAGIQASTTPTVTLRNNIIVNKIVPGGSGGTGGITAAYRRLNSTLTTYGAASNNNLISISSPASANNLVYYDVTNSDQTVAAFKTRVSPRDANTDTQDLTTVFAGTTCGNANFLHINTGVPTLVESGGVTVAGITTDFDGDTRNASTPDIGADEGAFANIAPAITLLVDSPSGSQCSAVARLITATVVPGAAPIVSVTLNYAYNGTPQAAITMTNVSGNLWQGTIPAATPTNANVTWSVTASDGTYSPTANGTAYKDDYLNGMGLTASADQTVLCGGGNVTLTAQIPLSGQIGTGTTTTSGYPSPYYTFYWGNREQYLILASELTAAGFSAGNIANLGFNLGAVSTTLDLTNFTISMKNTSLSSLASFETGLTQVYTVPAYSVINNANTITNHVFDTPFYWDGTSNVIVETCFNNSAYNGSETITYTTTGFTSVAYRYADNPTNCTDPSVYTSSSRPNMYLSGNAIGSYSVEWFDGNTSVGNGAVLTDSALTVGTHYFYAVITDGNGCTLASDSVTVNVNPLPSAPTTTNSTQCGFGVPTCSVSGSGGEFHWYDAASGGTLIQSDASATLLSYTINSTTSFWVSEFDGSCESPRAQVDATVTNGDTISAAASVSSTCAFVDFDLTATDISVPANNTYTYTWTASPASGSGIPVSVSGNPVTIQPTAGGTYTYTVTGIDSTAGCTSIATVSVTVSVPPTQPLPTAVPNVICAGDSVDLHANTYTSGSGSVSTGLAGGNGSQTNYFDVQNVSAVPITIHYFSANIASGSVANIYYKASSMGCSSPVVASYTQIGINVPITVSTPPTLIPFDANITIPAGATYSFIVDITGGSLTYSNGVAGCPVIASDSYIQVFSGYGGTISGSIAARNFNGVVSYSYLVGDPNLVYSWSPSASVLNDTVQDTKAGPSATTDYTVTVTDTSGCTNSGIVTVTVNPLPAAPVATNGSHCGYGLVTASVTGSGGIFNWYDAPTGGTLIQSDASATLIGVYTNSSSSYWVAEFDGTCESNRVQVDETVTASDSITAGASSATICLGASVDLTATNNGGGSGQTYTYTWSATDPNSGISTPVTGSPVTVTPLANGTYTYDLMGTDAGCSAISSVTVTVVNPPTISNASASPNPACAGTDVTLTAVTGTTGPMSVDIGTGTTTTSTYPNPYYTLYWGNREQYLILASELTSAGLTAGNIYSLGFTLGAVSTTLDLTNFTISMKNTPLTSISAFETGMTQVYTVAAYSVINNANTVTNHTFSTPFYWDGTSNLIVETCFNNSAWNGSETISYTNTAFTSCVYHYADASTVCGDAATTGTSTARPNMRINGTHSTVGAGSYTWEWNPGALSGNVVTVNPLADTDYTVTASEGACSSTQVVSVTVIPLPSAPTATNSNQCGFGIPTCSVSGSGGIFNWYDAQTGGTLIQSGSDDHLLSYAINTTTSFWVSEFDGTCESDRTEVIATVGAADQIDATSSAPVCQNSDLTLIATNITMGGNTYTYTWTATPAAGSGIPVSVTGDTVTIQPTLAGTYTYSVTGVDGLCTAVDSVTVTVTAAPDISSASASPNPACAGSDVTLTAVTGTTGPQLVTLGTGTSVNGASSTDATMPPFGQWYTGTRHQFLILASELNGLGLTAGPISSVAWNVQSLGGSSYSDFHVLIGSTALTSLTATFVAGLTDVYVNANYTPAVGWNTFTFSTPFTWDGTSNIIIESYFSNCLSCGGGNTCNSINYGNNDICTYTNTAFNSHTWYYSDGLSCSLPTITAASGTGLSRQNMQINGTHSTVGAGSYTWQWNPGALPGNVVTVNPMANTDYIVTALDTVSGCSSTDTVSVTVIPPPPAPTVVVSPSTQCGLAVPTCEVSGSGGSFNWYLVPTGGTALSGENGPTLTAYTIDTATTFYVSEFDGTCEGPRTAVQANVVSPDAVSASASPDPVCPNADLTLLASNLNPSPVNNYTYTWTASPAAGSGIPVSVVGDSVVIQPTTGGTYTYTLTAVDGSCTALSTVSVTVTPAPVILSATATPDNVCSGSNVTLTALTGTFSSGDVTIGTQSTTIQSGSPFRAGGGSPMKTQMLFLASELTTAGITPGDMSGISWYMTTGSGGTLPDYTIKMMNTTATALTATFDASAATTVYGPVSFNPPVTAPTTVSFTFNTPFTWDGTSNVIVEVCHENPNPTAGSGFVAAMTTGFMSDHQYLITGACSVASGSTTIDGNRPITTFTAQTGTSGPGTYTWQWNPGALNGNSVTVAPTSNTDYTVTATDPGTGCTSTATVSVTVITAPPTPVITGTPDSICVSGTVTLTLTNPAGGINYQWQSSATGDPGTWTDISGANSATYTSGTLSSTTFFRIWGSCGLNGDTSNALTVIVSNPSVTTGTVTRCGPGPVTMTVTGSGSFDWYTASSGGTPVYTGATYTTNVSGNTIFWVQAYDGSCNAVSRQPFTVTVDPAAGLVISAVPDTICAGQSVALEVHSTDAYTYVWTGDNGFNSTDSVTSDIPAVSTIYTVVASATGSGCNNTGTISVLVHPVPATPVVTASSDTLCAVGDSVVLDITNASFSAPGLVDIGTDVNVNGTTDATLAMPPFGQWYTGTRHQMLILASELTGAGVAPGPLTSVAFDVVSNAGDPYSDFHLLIGATSQTALTSTFIPGLTEKYMSASYTAVTGWNTFTFSTPFMWDGLSNIVVETYTSNCTNCSGGNTCTGTSYSEDAVCHYSITGFNSHAWYYSDGTSCSLPTITTSNAGPNGNRPNMRFNAIIGSGITYTWNPGGFNGTTYVAYPSATTTYTATASYATGCSSSATITVTYAPLTPPSITPSGATTFCQGGSVTLDAGAGYTSYEWSDGMGVVGTSQTLVASPSATTDYTVTVSNGTCSATATQTVSVYSTVPPNILGGTSLCSGSSLTLTVDPAYNSYLWSTSETTQSIVVNTGGTYSVDVTDANGCVQNASVVVTSNAAPPAPVVTPSGNQTLCWDGVSTTTFFHLAVDTAGAGPGATIVWNGDIFLSGDSSLDVDPNFYGYGVFPFSVTITNAAGCGATSDTVYLTIDPCSGTTLNLTMFIQGYYAGSGFMNAALYNSSVSGSGPNDCDTVHVCLMDTGTFAEVECADGILQTNGTVTLGFTNSGAYYVKVTQRNALQTWSAVPVTLSGSPASYDFSSGSAQAYGGNQVAVDVGVYGFWSGDVNQDELVESTDYSQVENDAFAFLFGYYASDVTGDGLVESADYSLVENNSFLFLFSSHP